MIGAVAASLARRRLMDQRQRQRTRQRQHQQQRQRQRQRARQESRRRFEQQEQEETTDHHMIHHSTTVRQQIRHVCSEVARNDDIERTDTQFVAHVARLEADFFQMLIAEDVSADESEEGGEENNGGDGLGLDYHQSSEQPNEMPVDGPSWRIRHDPDFDIPVAAVVPTATVVECSSRGTTNKSMQDRLQANEETQMAERVNGTILIRAKKSRMCSIQ